jgi:hypothetical protein
MTTRRADGTDGQRSASGPSREDERAVRERAEFLRQAAEAPPSLLAEFWDFLRHNKKWWLTPIIAVLLLVGLAVVLLNTGAAPFIYTLF